jgi:hypothetical protein
MCDISNPPGPAGRSASTTAANVRRETAESAENAESGAQQEDWVSDEEEAEFEGPDFEAEAEDEEDDQDDDADAAAPSTRGRQQRAPPVPPNFPQGVPPFEPYQHSAQPHSRRVQLPADLWEAINRVRGGQYSASSTGHHCFPECPRSNGQADERCAGSGNPWAGGSTAENRANLGSEFASADGWDIPARFFKLFFNMSVFSLLAANTNAYAKARGAGPEGTIAKDWRDTCAAEIMIFIGLIIYMGVFRSSQVGSKLPVGNSWR